MAKTPAPDLEYIRGLRTHWESVWGETFKHWASDIDPWLWRTAEIWPKGSTRSVYMPSTAKGLIDQAVATQMAFSPRLHRDPVGTGVDHEKDADAVESGLHAVLLDSMLHEAVFPFMLAHRYVDSYGRAVIQGPLMDFEDHMEEPSRDDFADGEEFEWAVIDWKNSLKSWNPIRIHAPHPAQVLMDPKAKQPKEVILRQSQPKGDLKAMVDLLRNRKRKLQTIIANAKIADWGKDNNRSPIDITEYWSTEWHAMVADEQLLFVEANALGFVPFYAVYSGFGQEATTHGSNSVATSNPKFLSQGILDPIISSAGQEHHVGGLKAQAQSMSAKHNAVIERSYLRIMSDTDPAELAEQLAIEDGPISGNDREIAFLKYPELERTLFQIGADISADIEHGTFPRDVAGLRQQGVSTVGQQAMLTTSSTRKFVHLSMDMNHMVTIVCRNILRLIDRLGEPLTVSGKTLKPDQIHHDYSITAEFQTIDPILQQAERELGLREIEVGVKSHESYRENDLRVANESLEKKRLIKQIVRQSPQYLDIMAKAVAEEDGMAEIFSNMDGEAIVGPDGTPIQQGGMAPLSPGAGGGGTQAMREILSPGTRRPPTPNLPPSPNGMAP